jgi:hypothetical protein
MDDDLDDLAYDRRQSKAGTIRRILGRAIAEASERTGASRTFQSRGAQL